MAESLIDLNEVEFDKLRFFDSIKYQPHPGQLEVHLRTERFRLVCCGTRWGKSMMAGAEVLASLLEQPDKRVWVVAPEYALTEKIERWFQFYLFNYWKDALLSWNKSKYHYQLINGSEAWMKSADNPISLAGEELDEMFIDEAPGVKRDVWNYYLRERLSSRVGKLLAIGTPKGRTWHSELVMKGKDSLEAEYYSKEAPTNENPYFPKKEWDLITGPNPPLPKRVIDQEYFAKVIDDIGGVFSNVRELAVGILEDPVPGEQYRMGVDLAKYQDYTVMTIVDSRNRVVWFRRLPHCDWSLQYLEISDAARKYNNAQVIIDSTGVGDPIFEALRKPPYLLSITGVNFSGGGVKQQVIENLAVMMQSRAITYPDIPELVNELEIYEYELTKGGRASFSAPAGLHDDCVISLALAVSPSARGWNMG